MAIWYSCTEVALTLIQRGAFSFVYLFLYSQAAPKGHSLPAGEYKYGWHALPRKYAVHCPKQQTRQSLDHGIRRRSIDAYKVIAVSKHAAR